MSLPKKSEQQQQIAVRFIKERDTKNTIRFAEVVEDGDPQLIGTIYVQKFALKQLGNPEQLTVLIRPA